MSFLSNILGTTAPSYATASGAGAPDVRTTLARLWSLFPEAPSYQAPVCPPVASTPAPSKPTSGSKADLTTAGGTVVHAEIVDGVSGGPQHLSFEVHAPGALHVHGRVAMPVLEALVEEAGRLLVACGAR